jgi:hypothetical protein
LDRMRLYFVNSNIAYDFLLVLGEHGRHMTHFFSIPDGPRVAMGERRNERIGVGRKLAPTPMEGDVYFWQVLQFRTDAPFPLAML